MEVENQLNRKFKVLQSDNGGKYVFNNFNIICQHNGTRKIYIVPTHHNKMECWNVNIESWWEGF